MTPPGTRRRRLLAALAGGLLVLAAGGCSLVRPHLERPTLSVLGVTVEHASLRRQELRVHLLVDNPNTVALGVRSVRFTIDLDGDRVGNGATAQPFTVAAHGVTRFDALVETDLGPTLLRLVPRLSDPAATVAYRLAGSAETDSLLLGTVPFDEHGTINLGAR